MKDKVKDIYIVRHGQSMGNLNREMQGPDVPLSSLGIEQAKLLGKRFASIDHDVILHSPYKRVIQTAQGISDATGVKLEELACVHERLAASSFWGMSLDSDEYKTKYPEFLEQWLAGERYEDAETLPELFARTKQLQGHIEQSPYESIVVVSHGHFIRTFLARIAFQDNLTVKEYLAMSQFVTSNTGITHMINEGTSWKIRNWNDETHL